MTTARRGVAGVLRPGTLEGMSGYYGQAAAYNTPYIGMDTREFADVAALAAHAVRGQTAFEKIYLLNALEPGLEAFEIFPACVRCS